MKIPEINILSFSRIAGVSISFSGLDAYTISCCLLTRKKGDIAISNSWESIEKVENLKELLPKKTPVVVNISGKVVLNKAFSESTDESKQVIPVNNPEDFYQYKLSYRDTRFLSICRKSVVDEILNEFSTNEIPVVNLNIGPYQAVSFWNFNLTDSDSIPVGSGMLEQKENTVNWQNNGSGQDSLIVSGEPLSSMLTMTYASALTEFIDPDFGTTEPEKPASLVDGFQFKLLIDKTKYVVLGLIFLVLIINFLSFDSLRKKESGISGQLQLNSSILARRDSLEATLKAKEQFIDYIGKNRTYYSQFLDEIAATVPSRITLNKLDVNPVDGKIQKKEAIKTQRKILISGTCNTSLTLNQWINQLDALEWIKEVIVLNYVRIEESGQGEFIIEIKLRK